MISTRWAMVTAMLVPAVTVPVAEPAKPAAELNGHKSLIVGIAMSGDGKRIVTGGSDQSAMVWNAAGEREHALALKADRATSVAISGDGGLIVTGSPDNAIFWDAFTGKQKQVFKGHADYVTNVSISGDGKLVVTGPRDFKERGKVDVAARLWDAANGNQLQAFQAQETVGISCLAISRDGDHLATGIGHLGPNARLDRAILWDIATGEILQCFQGHTARVSSIAIRGDGKFLLTGSEDNTAILWVADAGKVLQTYEGHTDQIRSVAMSGDGKLVATGSNDKTAIVWDAVTGKKLHTFPHAGVVYSVALRRDGKQLATTSGSSAYLWDIAEKR